VLPVVARRCVLTDNTFWHARWDHIDDRIDVSTTSTTFYRYVDYIGCFIDYSDYIIFFGFTDFHRQDAE
jgi:hypothetical protein